MNSRQVVVIGLGRFGNSLARTLSELGHEVLGLDQDAKRVEDVSEFVTQAVQVDATDEDALIELGLRSFDIGIVAIGSDLKSSILATLLLKRLGLRIVISKAQDELHGEILAKVGADRVVYPERETAIKIAHSLTTPDVIDYLQLSSGYGIAKLAAPLTFVGKELGQLDAGGRLGITILVLQRSDELLINPSPSEVILHRDILVIAGKDEQIEAMRTP